MLTHQEWVWMVWVSFPFLTYPAFTITQGIRNEWPHIKIIFPEPNQPGINHIDQKINHVSYRKGGVVYPLPEQPCLSPL